MKGWPDATAYPKVAKSGPDVRVWTASCVNIHESQKLQKAKESFPPNEKRYEKTPSVEQSTISWKCALKSEFQKHWDQSLFFAPNHHEESILGEWRVWCIQMHSTHPAKLSWDPELLTNMVYLATQRFSRTWTYKRSDIKLHQITRSDYRTTRMYRKHFILKVGNSRNDSSTLHIIATVNDPLQEFEFCP